jgi:hypothetical protein
LLNSRTSHRLSGCFILNRTPIWNSRGQQVQKNELALTVRLPEMFGRSVANIVSVCCLCFLYAFSFGFTAAVENQSPEDSEPDSETPGV